MGKEPWGICVVLTVLELTILAIVFAQVGRRQHTDFVSWDGALQPND
jgi:hypothetical protein